MVANSAATGYSNQRKLDRCQNGNLVSLVSDTGTNGTFRVSTDNGVTWTNPAIDIAGFANGSIFIDLDDYLHVVWKQSGTGGGRTDGRPYYTRGTPNAGRTSWTFATPVEIADVTGVFGPSANFLDVVAHREGTGWAVHNTLGYQASTDTRPFYNSMTITSGGTFSAWTITQLAPSTGVAVNTFPSIDFNHTGDGKTVAGGTPHLYVGWSAGTTGAGFGIRFRKAVYSAGAWTWNAEVEIDNTRYIDSIAYRWLNCLFDGTRVLIGGTTLGPSGFVYVDLYERDVADTTTTTRNLMNSGSTSTSGTNTVEDGSFTYDALGNVYFFGRMYISPVDNRVGFRKFTRADATYGAPVFTDYQLNSPVGASMKRGYSRARIEWVYTSGNNAPYAIKYDYLPVTIIGLFVKRVKTITELYRDKMRARGFNI